MSEHAFTVELVPIDRLEPNPRNVNEGDVGAIATAIAVDGWHGSVVARKRSGRQVPEIVAGEHRWRALASLQADGIDLDGVHRSYDDLLATKGLLLPPAGTVPAQVLTLDELRGLRKMVADNRASHLATSDGSALAELLADLAGSDDGLLGSLYDGDDLDALLADLAAGGPSPGYEAPLADDAYAEQYGVIVVCADEAEQEGVYDALRGQYEQVRVVTT